MSKIKEGDRVNVYGFYGEAARKATVSCVHDGLAVSVTWDEPVKAASYVSHTDVVALGMCNKIIKKKKPEKVVIENLWFSLYGGDLVLFESETKKVIHLNGKKVRATFEVIGND